MGSDSNGNWARFTVHNFHYSDFYASQEPRLIIRAFSDDYAMVERTIAYQCSWIWRLYAQRDLIERYEYTIRRGRIIIRKRES